MCETTRIEEKMCAKQKETEKETPIKKGETQGSQEVAQEQRCLGFDIKSD